jgi:hypothetical protein
MGTVARNFNIGSELHESALNLLSARLLKEHAAWFSRVEHIPIDPKSPHERWLVLKVDVIEPVSFHFSPVEGLPALKNQVVVRAAIRFQLTDQKKTSPETPITRIRAVLQAVASVKAGSGVVALFLEKFEVLHFVPEQPPSAPLLSQGSLDFQPSLLAHAAASGEVAVDDAFTAILNYLVAVFLEEGLRQPVAQFPLPQMQKLPVINLPLALRGLDIFSNRLGFYLRHEDGPLEAVSGTPPAPTVPEPHLSIGVVVESIRRVLVELLPLVAPLEYGNASTFFQLLAGSQITVLASTSLELRPPDVIRVVVRFSGDLHMRINVAIGGYQLHVPVELPLGESCHFAANWSAFARVDDATTMVNVMLRPKRDFMVFGPDTGSEILILTEWRKILKSSVLDWLRQNVSPILVKVPGIGWVVAKTVEVVASELAAAFGTVVDGLEGAFLSLMSSLLFQVLKTWFNDKLEVNVYSFSENLPLPDVKGAPWTKDDRFNLRIASISRGEVVDNQGGELVLRCWLSDQGVVVPEPPVPEPPAHPELPPTPGSPSLPSYPENSFQPVFALNNPVWRNGMELIYDQAGPDGVTQSVRTIRFGLLVGPDRWEVSTTQIDATGMLRFTSGTYFETPGLRPLAESNWGRDPQSDFTVTSSSTFNLSATAVDVEAQVNASTRLRITIPLPASARIVSTDDWILELMSGLTTGASGKLARLDLQPGTPSSNWARVLPMNVSAGGLEHKEWHGESVACLRVLVTDEQMAATLWIEDSATRRVLICEQDWQGSWSRLTLRR